MKTICKFLMACAQTVTHLSDCLEAKGIRLKPSFALRTALPPEYTCACTENGRFPCACELIILLAYIPNISHPLTIILQSSGQETWSSVEYPYIDQLIPHWAMLEQLLTLEADSIATKPELF